MCPGATAPHPHAGQARWTGQRAGSGSPDGRPAIPPNVSFADLDDNAYVSLSGPAAIVHDRAKMEALWQKPLEAWFPDGVDDPDLALLKVEVEHAEYWDQHTGLLAVAAGFVKAKVTGEESSAGYGVKVELGRGT